MTPDRHALIRKIFLAATGASPEERLAILNRDCGEDLELRSEVERLIAHHNDQTINADSQNAENATESWRQAKPQLNLDGDETIATPHRSVDPKEQQLSPGSLIAGRYRIVSQLGKGGMGVVYRAEDLTLGQTVALKFLNPSLSTNPVWLERFRNEVSLARTVTHPCVCRMFDIGEADGRHFLTMEYVDGEDLDSLSIRIGRLPRDKALDVARQICIGLAAAHDVGILHRDLKPANIMLDGRGQVRITDFGLAALPGKIRTGDIRSGTPAYMAPEQIAGREVTIQSDIYALGLVMYDTFAGRPAFQANTIDAYRELHEKTRPVPLSDVVEDIHPDVERIVMRCLEKNPKDRPHSALEVAAALPGGNLLAAALSANVTPTAEMVAAATPQVVKTLTPVRLVAITIALLAAMIAVRSLSPASRLKSGSKPPAVLAEQARELVKAAGYSFETGEQDYGYCQVFDAASLMYGYRMPIDKVNLAIDPVDTLIFWYRQSPGKLIPSNAQNMLLRAARVTPKDPPPGTPGMTSVVFDQSGRLLLFARTPEHVTLEAHPGHQLGDDLWDVFIQSASLDREQLILDDLRVQSLYQTNQAFAWRTLSPLGGDDTLHVEALSENGKPLFFAVEWSDEQPHMTGKQVHTVAGLTSLRIVFLLLAVFAIPCAWLNYSAGRSDRSGAMRLAIFIVVVQFVAWLLRAKHVSNFNIEVLNICLAGLVSVGVAAILGVFYTALEPLVRRFWPDMLITWNRVLSLRLRDPSVGHHVAVGVCIGCFWALVIAGERALVSSLGWDIRLSLSGEAFANNLLGGRIALAGYLGALSYAMFRGLLFLLLLAVLRAFVRRPLFAAMIAGVIIASMTMPQGAHVYTSWMAIGICGVAVGVWVMIRYGLLSLTVGLYVTFVLNASPITFDLNAWYADQSMYVLAIVAALTTYGYITARSGSIAR